ncbi:MAG: hypothetical protein V4481_03660 [Patescibacteria group bacterium]
MKNSQRGIVAMALLVIVALAFITGGLYIYGKSIQHSADDQLIRIAQDNLRAGQAPKTAVELYAQLAWEKARLQMETDKLNQLKAEAIKAALSDVYDGVGKVFDTSEIKVKNKVLQNQIDTVRAQINKIFDSWKALAASGGGEGSALHDAIKKDSSNVNVYIEQLKEIIDKLTPGNSGLTQAEIDALKKAIDDAGGAVNSAESDLHNAETGKPPGTGSGNNDGTQGNGTTTPDGNNNPPPNPIDDQKKVVDDIKKDIDDTQKEIDKLPPSPTPPPGTYVPPAYNPYTGAQYYENDTVIKSTSGEIIYPPNPAPIRNVKNYGGPGLIEGENSN